MTETYTINKKVNEGGKALSGFTYNDLLKLPEWIEKREEILALDNDKCSICGNRSQLQVHHRQYHKCKVTGEKILPWLYDNRYLITLCDSCHKRGHQQYQIYVFEI